MDKPIPPEPAPQATPYPLRLPDDMRRSLETRARGGGRSLNAEIVKRLQASLTGDADLAAQIADIKAMLARLVEAQAPTAVAKEATVAAPARVFWRTCTHPVGGGYAVRCRDEERRWQYLMTTTTPQTIQRFATREAAHEASVSLNVAIHGRKP